jgi:hypothetical protein
MKKLFFDIECYVNYFLIVFRNESGVTRAFELTENSPLDILALKKVIKNKILIGFNSKMYDIPMLAYALQGVDNLALKSMSNGLIPDKELLKQGVVKSSFKTICDNGLWNLDAELKCDHIDIINVIPGKSSLKLYGARIGSTRLQDLPYDHMKSLTRKEMDEVKLYCKNDVCITEDLYNALSEQFAVRDELNLEFGVDSRSKSDAQIADLVIGKLCNFDDSKINNHVFFKYKTKLDFNFKSPELKQLKSDLKHIEFEAKRYSKIKCENVHRKIEINGVDYSFGIGGLHSNEARRSLKACDNEWFIDIDVSSCYPKIILNNNLFPPQIEDGFTELYTKFYEERLSTDSVSKSKVLKIILNGSFGKFGDGYSKYLYAPELLITTTITGQLGLLLLIERLEEHGFRVISANTDGITVRVLKDKYRKFRRIINLWEQKFNYDTKEVKYTALHSHSVNSYIAVKEDGSLKLKGLFAENDLSRNIDVPLCKKAAIDYVTKGIKPEDSIYNKEHNPMDIIKIRKTKFGAYWKGEYLGHTVRWYWSTIGESITNSKGHRIAETSDAYPLMDLREPIKHLHYDKYVNKTYELLKLLGVDNY